MTVGAACLSREYRIVPPSGLSPGSPTLTISMFAEPAPRKPSTEKEKTPSADVGAVVPAACSEPWNETQTPALFSTVLAAVTWISR